MGSNNKKTLKTKGKTPAPRPTQIDLEMRIEIIKSALIDGNSRYVMVQHASKIWGIGARAVDDLIAKAKQQIQDEYAPVREKELAKHIARREKLFTKTLASEDYRTALAVDDSLAKLKGLVVDKTEGFIGVIDTNKLTQEQKQRIANGEKITSVIGNKNN